MPTLNIGGKRVKVGDEFLALSPEEQQKTVNEIAAQIGASAPAATARPPAAVVPAAAVEPVAASAPARSPNLMDATMATINGMTSAVPFLTEASDAIVAAGQTGIDALTGQPVDFGKNYNANRASRTRVAEAAPIANTLGQIGGVLGTAGVVGSTKAGAEALGMTGKMAKQFFNSVLSTGAYEGLSGLSKGHTGGELLADIGIGGASGLAGPIIGKAVEGTGQVVANALTDKAQSAITKQALASGAPNAAALRKEGSGYFGTSVDDNPVMITSDAYHRLLNNIQRSTERFRPNQHVNAPAIGVLQKFWQVADEINAPGSNTVVDLKDLHILRQAANDVADDTGISAQTREIAGKTIRQLDRFIKTMKPEDTLGGVDPTIDAENLMNGISTWARASKVGKIEKAIEAADTYKSGFENGLKQSFLKLMKSPDFKTLFSKVEQDAIRKVAHGTKGQNIAESLGKLGISIGGHGATNVIGAGAGTAGLTALLTPALGPLALPTAFATTTATGAIGRRAAEAIGRGNAERAAQIAATPGIRQATQRSNALEGTGVPLDALIRATTVGALGSDG